jgi:hypothetical protein
MDRAPFSYTLQHPLTVPGHRGPDGELLKVLEFPKMKGKFMRTFKARATQEQIAAQAQGEEAGGELAYDQFMLIGEKMIAENYGPVSARFIFDEMDPDDVHQVVALVGERFAGGLVTGEQP